MLRLRGTDVTSPWSHRPDGPCQLCLDSATSDGTGGHCQALCPEGPVGISHSCRGVGEQVRRPLHSSAQLGTAGRRAAQWAGQGLMHA